MQKKPLTSLLVRGFLTVNVDYDANVVQTIANKLLNGEVTSNDLTEVA